MKFFIPKEDNTELAEKIYQSAKLFAKDTLGWVITDRRIFLIEYTHDGKYHKAVVGQINDTNNEEIVAILESNAYLICTPNRGVLRGMPILVGQEEIRHIEDFE